MFCDPSTELRMENEPYFFAKRLVGKEVSGIRTELPASSLPVHLLTCAEVFVTSDD